MRVPKKHKKKFNCLLLTALLLKLHICSTMMLCSGHCAKSRAQSVAAIVPLIHLPAPVACYPTPSLETLGTRAHDSGCVPIPRDKPPSGGLVMFGVSASLSPSFPTSSLL